MKLLKNYRYFKSKANAKLLSLFSNNYLHMPCHHTQAASLIIKHSSHIFKSNTLRVILQKPALGHDFLIM